MRIIENKVICDIKVNETQAESPNLQNYLASGVPIRRMDFTWFPDKYEIISNSNDRLIIFFYIGDALMCEINTEYSLCFTNEYDEKIGRYIGLHEWVD